MNVLETEYENPFFCHHIEKENPGARFDFTRWWDPKRFNWTYSSFLAKYFSNHFEIWWNPESFNWRSCAALTRYCRRDFAVWWDPEKFHWNTRTVRLLTKHYGVFLDTWWDSARFPWKTDTGYLVRELSHRFDTWWNEDKFPWGTMFCNVPVEHMLVKYCSKYLPVWYSSEGFHLSEAICNLLKTECGDFKELWAKDYLLYRLSK